MGPQMQCCAERALPVRLILNLMNVINPFTPYMCNTRIHV
jgi:hypothetical protein